MAPSLVKIGTVRISFDFQFKFPFKKTGLLYSGFFTNDGSFPGQEELPSARQKYCCWNRAIGYNPVAPDSRMGELGGTV